MKAANRRPSTSVCVFPCVCEGITVCMNKHLHFFFLPWSLDDKLFRDGDMVI